ncbi:MAG: DnaA/Hda family protein [Pseudomonadota bacterium]
MNQQVPLALPVLEDFNREALVETSANRDAVALIDDWPKWSSPFALIIGPEGSGKTHIAAAWTERSKAIQLDIAELDSGFYDAKAFLLEDLTPGQIDETKLFHALNLVRQNQKTLLMTSRFHPSLWRINTPDLISRIRSAISVELSPPDDELLKAVMMKLFADRQVTVATGVIDYLLIRIERSLTAAVDIARALDEAALSRKTPVTKPLAREVLQYFKRQ